MQKLSTFIENTQDSLFPIQNLPYGIFTPPQENATPRVGVAIGDYVLDLAGLEKENLLKTNVPVSLFNQVSLNLFAAQGCQVWDQVRKQLQNLLSSENTELQNNAAIRKKSLFLQSDVSMSLPFSITGFSDFYASQHHASNVGKLFRGKENPLLPNWKYLPVGYNGRASTVFLSGTPIRRPKGQVKLPEQEKPIYSPSQKLDFELEMGIFVGCGNPDGQRISTQQARRHIFGLVLLNDWSARDIQAFEYQPLGPFLSKSFATSISPWVVPLAAFNDFMVPLAPQIPETVDYLHHPALEHPNIHLKVEIKPQDSHLRTTVCETNFNQLYWSMEQLLAHHTVNHCIMQPGDLLGSGTISGSEAGSWGSLLERTFNGTTPLKLNDGQERRFLEDGDTVIMQGFCENDHYRIGFGSLEGTIISAV